MSILKHENDELKEAPEDNKRGTVMQEKEKVLELEREGGINDGIRILGIDKLFSMGLCKKREVHALKGVDFINNNILGILRDKQWRIIGIART